MGRYRLLCDEGHKFRGERVGHLHFKKLILNNNYICNNKTQIHCINKTNKQVTSRGPWKIIRNWQCHVSSCVWDSSWKKKASHTFTTPFSLYSSHLTLSELNKIVYDVTHWGEEGLPWVAKFVSTLSSPRSICNHWPASFKSADQEPQNVPFGTLLRRASQDRCLEVPYTEEAVMAEFGKRPLSIPRAWIRHSVK